MAIWKPKLTIWKLKLSILKLKLVDLKLKLVMLQPEMPVWKLKLAMGKRKSNILKPERAKNAKIQGLDSKFSTMPAPNFGPIPYVGQSPFNKESGQTKGGPTRPQVVAQTAF